MLPRGTWIVDGSKGRTACALQLQPAETGTHLTGDVGPGWKQHECRRHDSDQPPRAAGIRAATVAFPAGQHPPVPRRSPDSAGAGVLLFGRSVTRIVS